MKRISFNEKSVKNVEKYITDIYPFKITTKIVTQFISIISSSHSVFRLCAKYVVLANTKKYQAYEDIWKNFKFINVITEN